MRLRKTDLAFLSEAGVHPNWVFDASQMPSKAECRRQMRGSNTYIALGLAICPEGHRLSSSRGECVQCKPGLLKLIKRHISPGYVYVAVARRDQLIKIGSCSDLTTRAANLNEHTYAGASDWRLRTSVYTWQAARLEHELHQLLLEWRVRVSYHRFNKFSTANEVFRCTPRRANGALRQLAELYGLEVRPERS